MEQLFGEFLKENHCMIKISTQLLGASLRFLVFYEISFLIYESQPVRISYGEIL